MYQASWASGLGLPRPVLLLFVGVDMTCLFLSPPPMAGRPGRHKVTLRTDAAVGVASTFHNTLTGARREVLSFVSTRAGTGGSDSAVLAFTVLPGRTRSSDEPVRGTGARHIAVTSMFQCYHGRQRKKMVGVDDQRQHKPKKESNVYRS